MSVAWITIYAKIMSGELIPLDVPSHIPLLELVSVVYQAIPYEIRPAYAYQVTLLEYQEVPDQKKIIELSPDDVLSVFITQEKYGVYLDYIGRAQDAEDGVLYERYSLEIVPPTNLYYYRKDFYTIPFNEQYGSEHIPIYVISSRTQTWTHPDDDELELFRLSIRPDLLRVCELECLSPKEVISVERADLLSGIHLHPSSYPDLLEDLERAWAREQQDQEQH